MTAPYRPFFVRLLTRRTISPGFVRITLGGDDLEHCGATLLDQRVKLVLGDPGPLAELMGAGDDWYARWQALPNETRPALRTYTLAAVRPERRDVDIDVAVHTRHDGPAPGLAYALEAPLGCPAVLVAPDARVEGHDTVGVAWQPGTATDVLLVGDETALPAVLNIVTTLPESAAGRVVLEVEDIDDVRPVVTPPGVTVDWRVRSRGEQATGVFGRVEGDPGEDEPLLWQEADGDHGTYGWVAGEAGWVRRLRGEAKAAGVPSGQVSFMGYWGRGVAG